jgi:mono/diheme cytochrome c family protein
MKLYKLLLPALCAFIFSCKDQPASTLNKILNRDQPGTLNKILNQQQLASQFFNVNINSDTTLVTKEGCIIKIPKQSLQSDSNNVMLEVKEALTTEQIVLAGLITMSGQQILSSGGMIYINAAAGYKVSIKKQLEVLVPTKVYNPDMNVFKGEEDENGKIDWKDPTPLPKDETITKIDAGAILFKSNCANCHKIYDDFTGPALYGITDRKSKQWLYDFTRNPRRMRSPNTEVPVATELLQEQSRKNIGDTIPAQYDNSYPDFYVECLFNKWAPTMMTAFPSLEDDALDALYSYVKA